MAWQLVFSDPSGEGGERYWQDDATGATARFDPESPFPPAPINLGSSGLLGVSPSFMPGAEGEAVRNFDVSVGGRSAADYGSTLQANSWTPGDTGTIVNPATGQREQAYGIDVGGQRAWLPKSLALQVDPNAQPYQVYSDGGYGGFGGFLDQMMVPGLMAAVGAAGMSGFGAPGLDFMAEIGGGYGASPAGVFGGGSGMELNNPFSWLDPNYSYSPMDSFGGNWMQEPTFSSAPSLNSSGAFGGDGLGWDYDWTTMGSGPNSLGGQLAPEAMNSAKSLIEQYGPTAAKAIISSSGGDGSIIDKILSNPSLLGAGLGGLAGLLGGSRQAGNITSVTDIPDWLKPYATDLLNRSRGQLDLTLANPSGVTPAGTNEYLKTLSGSYLDPASNPWLSKTFDMAADKVSGRVAGDFNRYNRLGSAAHQGVLGSNLNDLATSIYGGNYQQERSRQAAAAGGAPAFENSRVGAGFAPFSNYGNLFGGILGRTSSKSEPYFDNPMGNVMSGILGGSQLGKMFS